jgi:hypothetical protein
MRALILTISSIDNDLKRRQLHSGCPYRPDKFSTLFLRFSNVVGKCFLVQQNVYTVLRLRKTCSSCRNSGVHEEGSISAADSPESLPSTDFGALASRRFAGGTAALAFFLFVFSIEADCGICWPSDIMGHSGSLFMDGSIFLEGSTRRSSSWIM